MIDFSPELIGLTGIFTQSQSFLPYSRFIFQHFFTVSGTTPSVYSNGLITRLLNQAVVLLQGYYLADILLNL